MIDKALVMAVIALCVGGVARADVPPMDAYAYGFAIETQGKADFYRIELPLEFYGAVTDLLLRDMGVYDAEGQPVPRVLQSDTRVITTQAHRIDLNAFALAGKGLPSSDEIRVLLKQSKGETSVELEAGRSTVDQAKPSLSHIIDLKEVNQQIKALEFGWEDQEESFLGMATVTGSDDLIDWHQVSEASIASMRNESGDIVKTNVSLSSHHYDYLRVVFDDVPDNFTLTGTKGVYIERGKKVVRRWVQREVASKDDDGGLIFEVGGVPLIDRIHVQLPESNVVVTGVLYCWVDRAGRWERVDGSTFYHVGSGDRFIQNSPLSISPRRASRWKLVIVSGRKDVEVKVGFGWRPDNLVFVAQGDGPYTLAVGRAADKLEGFLQESQYGDRGFLKLLSTMRTAAVATLGTRYELGGDDVLELVAPIPWKRIVLMGVLVIGVGMVGWMVLSLIRQMGTEDVKG